MNTTETATTLGQSDTTVKMSTTETMASGDGHHHSTEPLVPICDDTFLGGIEDFFLCNLGIPPKVFILGTLVFLLHLLVDVILLVVCCCRRKRETKKECTVKYTKHGDSRDVSINFGSEPSTTGQARDRKRSIGTRQSAHDYAYVTFDEDQKATAPTTEASGSKTDPEVVVIRNRATAPERWDDYIYSVPNKKLSALKGQGLRKPATSTSVYSLAKNPDDKARDVKASVVLANRNPKQPETGARASSGLCSTKGKAATADEPKGHNSIPAEGATTDKPKGPNCFLEQGAATADDIKGQYFILEEDAAKDDVTTVDRRQMEDSQMTSRKENKDYSSLLLSDRDPQPPMKDRKAEYTPLNFTVGKNLKAGDTSARKPLQFVNEQCV